MMSAFTHKVTQTVESIPNEPGSTALIRKLAPRHLEAAAKESQRRSLNELKEMGVSFIKELRSLTEADISKATTADPLLTYDVPTLIEKGVVSWTLSEDLTPENISSLDEDAQDYLARAILKLSRPKLFQSVEDAETERKND